MFVLNETVLIRQIVDEVPPMSAEAFETGRRRLLESVGDTSEQRGRRARRIAVVAWLLALVCLPLVLVLAGDYFLDLQVYRNGGVAWLRGIPLYVDFPGPLGGPRLPFTYPPVAAVLFSVLASLPVWVTDILVTVVSFLALSAVCVVVAGRVDRRLMWTVGPAAAVVALALEPVLATFTFGQVNLVLMGLVVADCLVVRDPRLRGVLVGLAAAIKLTPAVFVVYFLVRRDWRAAGTSAATFVGLGLAGFLVAPKDSVEYWFHALLDPSRIGGLAFSTNQSLRGILHRLAPAPAVETLLWALLSAVVVLLAVIAASRTRDDVVALLAISLAGLLASPVSWSHHWVWCVPAFLVLGMRVWRTGEWRHRAALGGVLAVFVLHPVGWLPQGGDRELDWSLWQHVPGDAYVWVGIAALVVLAFRLPPTHRRAPR